MRIILVKARLFACEEWNFESINRGTILNKNDEEHQINSENESEKDEDETEKLSVWQWAISMLLAEMLFINSALKK